MSAPPHTYLLLWLDHLTTSCAIIQNHWSDLVESNVQTLKQSKAKYWEKSDEKQNQEEFVGRHWGYCSFGTQPWSPYLPGTYLHHHYITTILSFIHPFIHSLTFFSFTSNNHSISICHILLFFFTSSHLFCRKFRFILISKFIQIHCYIVYTVYISENTLKALRGFSFVFFFLQ